MVGFEGWGRWESLVREVMLMLQSFLRMDCRFLSSWVRIDAFVVVRDVQSYLDWRR